MTDTAKKSTEPERPTEPQQEKTEDAPIVKADFSAMEKVKVAGELDLLTTAKAFAASGMFSDVKTQSQALVKIIAGYELQIPPFASMTGFHCIPRRKQVDGKWVETVEVSMSANLRAAVVRRDGNIDLKILEQSPEACEVEVAVKFAGQWEKRGSVRYTIEEAREVQVPAGGGNMKPLTDGQQWKNYPADMLFAAVMRRISKRYAPHLFIGDRPSDDEDDLITASATEEAPIDAELVEDVPDNETPSKGPEAGDGDAAGTAATDTKRSESGPGNGSPDGGDGHAVARDADAPDGKPEPQEPEGRAVTPEPVPGDPAAPAEEGERVGLLWVPRASKGPWLATSAKEMRTKDQCDAALKLLAKLSMIESALALICKARYNVALGQVSKIGMDELNRWLEAQAGIAEAKGATPEEPAA